MITETFNLIPSVFKLISKSIEVKFKKSFGVKIKPIFINFLITYQCDSRCVMCHIWSKYKEFPKLKKQELSLKEIEKFLIDNREFLSEVKHFGITGGEPLMRPDIVSIIKLIRRYLPNATTGFQTNGLKPELVKKRITEIKKFYPEINISVSLDGLSKTHDKVRGVKGAFEKVIKTYDYLDQLKMSRSTSGMTISSLNYQEIKEVKELVEKRGLEFSCFLVDKADYFNNLNLIKDLDKKMKKKVIEFLKDNFSDNYYMDNLRLQLEGKAKRTLPCYSGHTSIVIDPYGNVKPCILRDEMFGNIKDKKLEEILTSNSAKQLKRKLEKCQCWNQCEVSSSAIIDFFDVLKWFITSKGKVKFLNHLKIVQKDLKI